MNQTNRNSRVVTFGEIMLRLAPNGYYRFFQNDQMQATFGGGEANVAVSLANYGMDAAFLTVLPDNAIADACVGELRRFGVDTSRIQRGKGRMGIYYLETGASQRATTLTTPPFSPMRMIPSQRESTPVSPSEISKAVLADEKVEFMMAGNTSTSPMKMRRTSATTKATRKKAIQI